MASDVFLALMREQVDVFRAAFSTTSTEVFFDTATGRLRHTGEYGTFRESIVRDFLKFVVPRSLDMSTGFVITSMNKVSTQCDVVIFDSRSTPLYVEGDRQRFFPIECVYGIGEVKSTLSRSELALALNKLAKIKQMSDQVQSPSVMGGSLTSRFDPLDDPRDLVPSFLICQRFNFDHSRLEEKLDAMYDPNIGHRTSDIGTSTISSLAWRMGYFVIPLLVAIYHIRGWESRTTSTALSFQPLTPILTSRPLRRSCFRQPQTGLGFILRFPTISGRSPVGHAENNSNRGKAGEYRKKEAPLR